jgi:hypothetical protein
MKTRLTWGLPLLLAAALFVALPGCQQKPETQAVNATDAGKARDQQVKAARLRGMIERVNPSRTLLTGATAPTAEHGHNWKVGWKVEKWPGKADARAIRLAIARGERPASIVYAENNILLTAGITRMLNLLTGAGGQALDNTHARLGVGDGSTAVVIGDTDLSALSGSTHRWFQVMDATYPSVATNVVTFKSTFASADGNFAWAEFGTDAGTASSNAVTAPLLNRKVQSLGTKVSGASWALTETITISRNHLTHRLRRVLREPLAC